jgi:hypothetical protein
VANNGYTTRNGDMQLTPLIDAITPPDGIRSKRSSENI